MRRHFLLTLLLLLLTTALASAQASESELEERGEPLGIPLEVLPGDTVTGLWSPDSLVLEEIDPSIQASLDFPPAGDTCAAAAPIVDFPVNQIGGGQTIVNDFSHPIESDPVLSCMWGAPSSLKGYRSAWYRFSAPASGYLTVSTQGSSYDTVVGIFSGPCDALQMVACNDDYMGLTAKATGFVQQGRTYYILVVDWNLPAQGTITLNLTAGITSNSRWTIAGNMGEAARSRHVAVTHGPYLYVVGGQTVTGSGPTRTARMDRYDTRTGTWQQLESMPWPCGGSAPDGGGYANTTAAVVNGRIYIPAGHVGDGSAYHGTHCMYDIINNQWHPKQPNHPADAPWPGGEPFAYSAAAAYQNSYFLTGGLTGRAHPDDPHGQPRSEVFRYFAPADPHAPGNWNAVASMPVARYAHVAGRQQIGGTDHICVASGIGASAEGDPIVLSQGHCYNIAAGQWTVTTGEMNVPRYNAGSAVSPDGVWYVFGGADAAGVSVAVTERYDPATNSWIELDNRYYLGQGFDLPHTPPRAWPRGGFVGGTLWVTGGHQNLPENQEEVIPLVERLFLPTGNYYLPTIFGAGQITTPGATFDAARLLHSNQPQHHAFTAPQDTIHTFAFDFPSSGTFWVRLTNIPVGSNYDVHVYTDNKGRIVSGTNVGNQDEHVPVSGGAGRYYIFVERVYPPPGADPSPQPYQIVVNH